MARQHRKILLLLSVIGVFSLAEVPSAGTQSSITNDAAAIQNNTSFPTTESQAAQNPASSASSGNGISQGIVSGTVHSANEVQENQQNNSNGREYKAADARNQGQKGSAMAIAMGSSFLATGIPMLASPILPVRIAGADLVAKAGLEFAQAGADRASANKNDAQNKLLRQNAGQGGKEATANNASGGVNASEIASPQLTQLLASKGIDPAAFTEALASGSMTTASAVLGALGETSEISAEDQAAADAMAGQMTGNIFAKAEPNTRKELSALAYEDQGAPSKDGEKGGAIGGAASASGSAVQIPGVPGSADAAALAAALHSSGAVKTAGAQNIMGGVGDVSMDALKNLLAGLGTPTFANGTFPSKNPYAGMSEAQLRKLGIIGKGSGNIFQIAGKRYQSFGRWRGPKKKLFAHN